MRKRDSLRRWKARCRIGRRISSVAILNYRLDQWFKFTPVDTWSEFYRAYTPGGLRIISPIRSNVVGDGVSLTSIAHP